MTDITPKSRTEGQRGHVIHTRPWPEIVERYRVVVTFAPMLRFVEAIAASPVSAQLFAATSMFDLFVSDCADFRFGDNTLCIAFRPSESTFHFRHHTFSGHDDQKTCAESEALQTFRLFVRLKYGVFF